MVSASAGEGPRNSAYFLNVAGCSVIGQCGTFEKLSVRVLLFCFWYELAYWDIV